ncbi:MAG: hypothetical protein WCI73_03295 [Phycisphaerae bacterium]
MDEFKPAKPLVKFDEIAKIDLRVARVLGCREHLNADKLLVLTVDLGGGETRQICAGLKGFYKPDELVGRLVIVVANLEPRTLRGEASQGMVLAASEAGPDGIAKARVIVLSPCAEIAPGSPVS